MIGSGQPDQQLPQRPVDRRCGFERPALVARGTGDRILLKAGVGGNMRTAYELTELVRQEP
jgi:hypothetical protein